jgi:hypothetical protein
LRDLAPATPGPASCDQDAPTLAPTPDAEIGARPGTTIRYFGDYELFNTLNDGSFSVFIPDKGNQEMVIRRSRTGLADLAQGGLAQMQKVE